LDQAARDLIRRADTFFIATAYPAAAGGGSSHGVDVSHRGGKPGFVRVDADGTLTAPDFIGNFFFNTLGNLAVNPRAGLLFVDFDSGDLLHVAADAQIIWEGRELESFAGAQRLLRFHVREMRRIEGALPLRWGTAGISPFLARTGDWSRA
jgi:predicted pyridoxine 5'-phosphate oxidase superfamily flavin-nucleotide-binding protein